MTILKNLLLLFSLLLLSACADKVPFKEKQPLEDSSLVYIYILDAVGSDDSVLDGKYAIRIDKKRIKQKIDQGEYMVFDMKPSALTISATKKEILEKTMSLDLKAGRIYYLKIVDAMDGDEFEFVEIDNAIAIKEIAKTGLSGSSKEDVITQIIKKDDETPPLDAQKQDEISKTDEIQKAYDMKEKGIISEEEFQTLKNNILDKK